MLATRLAVQALAGDNPLSRSLMRLRKDVLTLPARIAGDPFVKLCDLIIPGYSMVDPTRLRQLLDLASDVRLRGIQGAIVECGSWRGGSAAILAYGAPHRDVWLFDSFEGMPTPSENDSRFVHDSWHKGWCKGSEEAAREILRRVGVEPKIVKGWFEDTLPVDVGPIALLHVDSDWFESVKICLDSFYDQVVSGGVIIFDDYHRWAGCRKAVDQFVAARRIAGRLVAGRYLVKP